MQNWDDLRFVLALGRHDTMASAARALGTNVATVSRRIDKLNDQYGEPLFVRSGTQWKPTLTSARLIEIAQKTEDRLTDFGSVQDAARLSRELRIDCEPLVLQANLVLALGSFLDEHPHVRLTVGMGARSLAFGETDILITTDQPKEGRIVRKRLATQDFGLYCDTRFAADPKGWMRIEPAPGRDPFRTDLTEVFDAPARIVVPGLNVALQVMRDQPLVCALPRAFAERVPNLHLWRDSDGSECSVWLAYHATRRNDPVVREAVTWISGCF